ncbi:unnamed protein product [Timema podura]|uniref:Uncharacterized protein n=1 Tax=Timema podura TaxID=61482 RepID=A0ABN7P184_TIMPD|nr:unnamed protein product [Timema podura]
MLKNREHLLWNLPERCLRIRGGHLNLLIILPYDVDGLTQLENSIKGSVLNNYFIERIYPAYYPPKTIQVDGIRQSALFDVSEETAGTSNTPKVRRYSSHKSRPKKVKFKGSGSHETSTSINISAPRALAMWFYLPALEWRFYTTYSMMSTLSAENAGWADVQKNFGARIVALLARPLGRPCLAGI